MTTQIETPGSASGVALHRIQNVNSNLYLTADAANDSAQLTQTEKKSDGDDALLQLWGLVPLLGTSSAFRIFNAYNGRCVDADHNDNPPGNSNKVISYAWKTSDWTNQQWVFDATQQVFKSAYADTMVWDIDKASTEPGGKLQLYTYDPVRTNQRFRLE